jgi:hypothetical protein
MMSDGTKSFDDHMGEFAGALRAKEDGEVIDVNDDHIVYRGISGKDYKEPIWKNLPFNRKSGSTRIATAKIGDQIKKGGLLARSNYTDKDGALALGMNARVGLVPFKGWSMDDAIVISEPFAQRLTSEHTDTYSQDFDADVKGGQKHYVSLFPHKFTKDQLSKLDEHGVVQPGQIVRNGDPLFLATRPKAVSSQTSTLGRLSRIAKSTRSDASQIWDSEEEGIVTDTAKTKNGFKVVVQSYRPAKVGDKITQRLGNKGIISRILAEDRMPRTTDGKPLEVLMNPLGVPSRVNSAIIYEMLLGKAAAKQGKPIKVPGFTDPDSDWWTFVRKTLDENGLTDKEDVFDPTTNKLLENPITVGNMYVSKLLHVGESKLSGRGVAGYDCFDANTEVLTRRGWVAWPDVAESDEFYTPDPSTNTASYEKPSRLVAYDFEGNLLHYVSRQLDFAVTNNHKFLARPPKDSRRPLPAWRDVTAQELKSKPLWAVPQFGYKLQNANNCAVKVIPGLPAHRCKKNHPDLVLPFEDYAAFMGWWVAEGSVKTDEGRVYIWQSDTANHTKSLEIEALLKRLFRAVTPHQNRGWRVNDRRLSEFVKNYGVYSHLKRIPDDLIYAGQPAVSAFLNAYIKGDGSHEFYQKSDGRAKLNEIRKAGSCSVMLLNDMQRMLIHQGDGLIPRISVEAGGQTEIRGTIYDQQQFYVGALQSSRKTAEVVPENYHDPRYKGAWKTMPYSGKIYCATTSTGYLYVRRNGKPMVSGNSQEQPSRGSGEGAQSKRMSGLEVSSLLSAGAYKTLRENSTLRGQKNDEFWRQLRAGQNPAQPGEPFVYKKFQALLTGAGLLSRKVGPNLRLGPMTDKELDRLGAIEVKNHHMVHPETLEPTPGGLFDPGLVGAGKFGKITLPHPIPNPAMEKSIMKLLGLSRAEFREILAGRAELPEHLR